MRYEEIKKIVVATDLLKAYLVNLLKSAVLVGFVGGCIYGISYILGENPFISAFEEIGLPISYLSWAVKGILALFMVIVIIDTFLVSTNSLEFEGDSVIVRKGFSMKKSLPIISIIRVNYTEYYPLKLGELEIEMSGTEVKSFKVSYVSRVKENCQLLEKLVQFKKSQRSESMIIDGAQYL